MTLKRVAIVGGGASGLFLARLLSQKRRLKVTVFEKNAQTAAKLRASGGGRANIFNRIITPEDYNNADFAKALLSTVSPEKLDEQFRKFGLVTVYDSENRVYPATQFSQTVVDVLSTFDNNNVDIHTGTPVTSLSQKEGGAWIVNGNHGEIFDTLVLATGSPANLLPKFQSDYNKHLAPLHLKATALKPSLAGFLLENIPKSLSGCRTKAIVSLTQDNHLIHKEKGEVIFKDEGISGIVVMNLSSYYRRLKSTENCRLSINLTHWDENFDVNRHLTLYGSLTGIIHPKLESLYKKKPFDIQDFTFKIKDTYPTDSAQVCSGGINVGGIDRNFLSKKHKNLYILGEMLDIDGLCGGYNLFFAFASAMVAGNHILKSL